MSNDLHRRLEATCPGRVIGPRHHAYDAVRQLFNGMYDTRPAVICLPRDAAEVGAVVRHARDAGIATTVRGAGHNIGGAASVADGLVLDLRLIKNVTIDPAARLARVGGGATWATFDDAAATYGLATTGGTFDTTGVGGLTLGGGIGHLMGRYGLACDNVESYTLITADGEQLVVDAEREPELNWALRGAGHHFGVVTDFTFRMHSVPTVYGGFVAYPGDRADEALRLFRDLMSTAPDELTCTLLLERHGPAQDKAAVMSVAYCGDDAGYRAELDRVLRSVAPIDWQIRDRTYLSMQMALGRLPYGLQHYWSARCVDAMPEELVDGLVERFAATRVTDPCNNTILIEPIHGAVRHGEGAVPFRDARFNITGMAIWTPPANAGEQVGWARSVAARAEPHSRWGDGYVNYVTEGIGEDGSVRAVRTFGVDAYRRLADLKRKVDPDGFFTSTYTISPDLSDAAR